MTTAAVGTGGAAGGSVPTGSRSLAPDLARGVMLLLIAMAYAPLYLYEAEPGIFNHPAGGSAVDQVVQFAGLLVLDSRAYPMFSALFGYGMATMVSRRLAAGASSARARGLLRRRGLFLLLFGFAHGVLVFPGEILGPYGIASLLLAGLMLRSDRALLLTAAAIVPIYLVTVPLVTTAMTFSDVAGAAAIPGYTGTDLLARLAYPFVALFNVVAFPYIIPMLLGAWAGRRRILDEPHAHLTTLRRTAVIGVSVSVVGGLPIALVGAGALSAGEIGAALLLAVQVLTGLFGGVAYAAIFGLLAARRSDRRGVVTTALAATGKRSLTCYLLQSVLLALVLGEAFLGLGGRLHSATAALAAIAAWLVGVVLAYVLERADQRGPADALLRRLVYRRA